MAGRPCRSVVIAALQMYDWPEVQPRTDAFWVRARDFLRDAGVPAPSELLRPADIAFPWTAPDLLLGQTCGLPFVSGRCGDAVLVAQPDYALPGLPKGYYASALICRADDDGETLAAFAGQTAAVNEIGSQSGCNALADSVMSVADGPRPFFGAVVFSGAHRRSADLVVQGQADIAAIDAVAWQIYAEVQPNDHARLRVLDWTKPTPALPFITAPANASHRTDLWRAICSACADLPDGQRPPGLPVSVQQTDQNAYAQTRQMARRVARLRLGPETVLPNMH